MIDVYVKAEGIRNCLLTIGTCEAGVSFTVAKGEREVTSIVIPWDNHWELMRELNACERALLGAQRGEEGDDAKG